MRERGDLAGFTGTAAGGATATESVAACICRGLRRQYAIESLPSRADLEIGPGLDTTWITCGLPERSSTPFGQVNARFSDVRAQSNLKTAVLRSNRRQPFQNSPRRRSTHGNHKNVNKSKGPDKMSGPLVNETGSR